MNSKKYKILTYLLFLLTCGSSITTQSQFVEYNELEESMINAFNCEFENQEKDCFKSYTFHNAGNEIEVKGTYIYSTFYWNHKFDIKQIDRHYCTNKLIDDFSFLRYSLISITTDSTLLTFKNDAF